MIKKPKRNKKKEIKKEETLELYTEMYNNEPLEDEDEEECLST